LIPINSGDRSGPILGFKITLKIPPNYFPDSKYKSLLTVAIMVGAGLPSEPFWDIGPPWDFDYSIMLKRIIGHTISFYAFSQYVLQQTVPILTDKSGLCMFLFFYENCGL